MLQNGRFVASAAVRRRRRRDERADPAGGVGARHAQHRRVAAAPARVVALRIFAAFCYAFLGLAHFLNVLLRSIFAIFDKKSLFNKCRRQHGIAAAIR